MESIKIWRIHIVRESKTDNLNRNSIDVMFDLWINSSESGLLIAQKRYVKSEIREEKLKAISVKYIMFQRLRTAQQSPRCFLLTRDLSSTLSLFVQRMYRILCSKRVPLELWRERHDAVVLRLVKAYAIWSKVILRCSLAIRREGCSVGPQYKLYFNNYFTICQLHTWAFKQKVL